MTEVSSGKYFITGIRITSYNVCYTKLLRENCPPPGRPPGAAPPPAHSHGWMNIQALQVNIEYSTEEDLVRKHNKLRTLLPYLVAITASSPIRNNFV